MQIDFEDFLTIEGRVTETKVTVNHERKVVEINVSAKMSAANMKNGVISFVNPTYWKQSEEKDFFNDTKYYSRQVRGINSQFSDQNKGRNESIDNLKKELEKGNIIENLIVELKPGKRYYWDETIYFEFRLTPQTRKWKDFSWMELREISDSFWMRFEYCLPERLEILKPKLNKYLDEKWREDKEFPIARFRGNNFQKEVKTLMTNLISIKFDNIES
ncbi:MAG: hypothetical protein ABIP06_01345 [Pyrinomonadaceae bacterium]